MAQYVNVSESNNSFLHLVLGYDDNNAAAFLSEDRLWLVWFLSNWGIQAATISLISIVLLSAYVSATWSSIPTWSSMPPSTSANHKEPPQMPYFLPVVGNLIPFLFDPSQLACSIRCVAVLFLCFRMVFQSKN
jgi:hypothetical protein